MIRVTRFGLVNAYLVEEDDGLTLVDTLIRNSAKTVLAQADEIGRPITRIALTHSHADHMGSLDELAGQLPDAEVVVGRREARLLAKDLTLEPGEEGKLRGGFPGAETKPTRTLEPGDRVGSLEVVPSPGHTPGHMAFLDTRDRTLYCGDAFTTFGGVHTSAKLSWPFPFAAIATWSRPVELETARALRALEPARLAPGHGPVVDDPGPGMDRAIAKAKGV